MIQVSKIKKVDVGNLKGFASVDIDGITIHDFRIVQQTGQKAWVSAPQTAWKDNDGKTHYKNLVELQKELKEQVSAKVLEEWTKN